ncbi:ThiF family adenylyltransferase [Shewanella psychromarinicola]|uniref:Uncharacterized protein n=1 Tax=Shewanella psychromarinicola TaxID=2487742 RepID=A0A3N4D9H6_9GAMM|nr:ThiF family adenylyltransferase [Shewanella psychromarinicola]AZG34009.1 hypothetical protein EGC80_03050 [Shewanella psychromarinicola]MCL1084416.1 ThiF family adenylyltransferase [Shewanella psychromarinicola]RPA22585.1 hypothetical protein EGC77_21385 [Shewanella psychromarinicola]
MIELELDDLYDNLNTACLISNVKNKPFTYTHELQGNKKIWFVELEYTADFPKVLPRAKLLNNECIGKIPHVNNQGTICYQEEEGILINYHDPLSVLDYILTSIANALDRWSLKIFIDDLFEEYEGYIQADCKRVNSLCSPVSVINEAYLKVKKLKDGSYEPFLLYEHQDDIPISYSDISDTNSLQVIKVLCINFERFCYPPKDVFTSHYFKENKSSLSNCEVSRIDKYIKKVKSKRSHFIYLTFPRGGDFRAQVLLKFVSEKSDLHPLLDDNVEWEVTSFLQNRINKTYLLERGGANTNLQSSHVAVIGCGSVGSEVALMLSKSGVGKLTLIDSDWLDTDNIYRHRLGGEALKYNAIDNKGKVEGIPKVAKVHCLSNYIKSNIPFIDIEPIAAKAEIVLRNVTIDKVDVVIIAIGSPSESLHINALLKSRGIAKVVHCWNEAASVGGHSVKFNMTDCCLECLYTPHARTVQPIVYSLIKPGQNISKNLTGCAGVFTPFSYLDSSKTAIIASNQCIEFLEGKCNSSIRSWKNNDFAKYPTTEYFDSFSFETSSEIVKSQYCSVCN